MSSGGSFRGAVGWSFVMTGGQQIITLVITFVLAAVLGPEAFGTVAMAAVYVAFAQLMVRQGMVPAIVQRKRITTAHLDTAFWMTMAMTTVMMALSVLLAPWWASVNDLPELTTVIWWLSLTIPLKGLTVVQEGLMRRRMRFKSLAARTNGAALIGGAVGVIAAFAGAGIWALVAQQIVGALVEVLTLWWVSEWHAGRFFRREAARDLLSFTSGSMLASLGTFVNNRGDALIIGLFFGPIAVGLYRLAARIVNVVVDVSARALQQATLPELARLQDDRERFRERTTEVLRTTALLSLPAFAVLAGAAPALLGLLGEEWEPAAVPLQLLCVGGVVRSFGLVVGAVLQATGRPHLFAVVTWGAAALSTASFIVAGVVLSDSELATQVNGLAASRAIVFAGPLLVVNVLVLRSAAGVAPLTLGRSIVPALAASSLGLGLGLVGWATLPVLHDNAIAAIVFAGLLGLVTAAALWRLEPRLAAEVQRLRRRGRRGPSRPATVPAAVASPAPAVVASTATATATAPVAVAAAPAETTVPTPLTPSTPPLAQRAAMNTPSGQGAALTGREATDTLSSGDPEPSERGPEPVGATPSPTEEHPTAVRSKSMDVWETLRIVLRRWTVSVPLAVLTVVAVIAIPSDVGQEYSSEASLVFLPPNSRVVVDESGFEGIASTNAFLDQSGAVAAMTQIIQLSLSAAETRALVEAEGLDPDYVLEVDRGNPIMRVSVTAGSPALATGTVDYLVNEIQDDLTRRQDEVEAPEVERIGIQLISPTSPALASTGAATRLRLIVLVIGLAFSIAAALLVEGAANWAGRRRSEGWDGDEDDDAPDEPQPTPAPAVAAEEPPAEVESKDEGPQFYDAEVEDAPDTEAEDEDQRELVEAVVDDAEDAVAEADDEVVELDEEVSEVVDEVAEEAFEAADEVEVTVHTNGNGNGHATNGNGHSDAPEGEPVEAVEGRS